MPTVAFVTLGCKVNFYDTEGIWHSFQARGYRQVSAQTRADVYVINTCTVTNTGDKKSRQAIRRAIRQNPDATVVVTGCYAQVAPAEIAALHGVDLVIGNDEKSKIVDHVERIVAEQQPYQSVNNILKTRSFEEFDVPTFDDRTRASLKIQDGCNNFCTFCIIPYARGLIRSRQPDNILAQARKLAQAGYREIVLTGIHTGGYGADLASYRLANLLRDLAAVDQLYRIRISSIEASEIDDELIETIGLSTKVCQHLHIPLQSGHNEILRKMNRHYTVEAYADKLSKLRRYLPDMAITSDVIVGFPGETDDQFESTEAFIRNQRFSQLHVFPYSPRRGTPAAKFANQVPAWLKQQRVDRLIDLSKLLTETFSARFHDKVVEFIPEGPLATAPLEVQMAVPSHLDASRLVFGHADNYLRVVAEIPQCVEMETVMGEVIRARVTKTGSAVQMALYEEHATMADAVFVL